MLLDDLTCDGKPKSHAAKEGVATLFEVVEAIEDTRQVFFCDSDSLIFDSYQ